MTKCLIALGSNLGDRAATLDAAIAALAGAPGVESVQASAWQLTLPVGGDASQRRVSQRGGDRGDFARRGGLARAACSKSKRSTAASDTSAGADRTLDLDLLLYGDAVIDTPTLTVPHPRMSFRRFVLEPAVEIAGDMVHPTIGWTLERLLDHLDVGIRLRRHRVAGRLRLASNWRRPLSKRYARLRPSSVDARFGRRRRPPGWRFRMATCRRASEADDPARRPVGERAGPRPDAANRCRDRPQRTSNATLSRRSRRFGLV